LGYIIGGLRQILTKRQRRKSARETVAKVITFFHNHQRWMQYNVYPLGQAWWTRRVGLWSSTGWKERGSAGA
jgi:hypothetical protein